MVPMDSNVCMVCMVFMASVLSIVCMVCFVSMASRMLMGRTLKIAGGLVFRDRKCRTVKTKRNCYYLIFLETT